VQAHSCTRRVESRLTGGIVLGETQSYPAAISIRKDHDRRNVATFGGESPWVA
jgi:hypothetical protein